MKMVTFTLPPALHGPRKRLHALVNATWQE